jgi:hypothetical protein
MADLIPSRSAFAAWCALVLGLVASYSWTVPAAAAALGGSLDALWFGMPEWSRPAVLGSAAAALLAHGAWLYAAGVSAGPDSGLVLAYALQAFFVPVAASVAVAARDVEAGNALQAAGLAVRALTLVLLLGLSAAAYSAHALRAAGAAGGSLTATDAAALGFPAAHLWLVDGAVYSGFLLSAVLSRALPALLGAAVSAGAASCR